MRLGDVPVPPEVEERSLRVVTAAFVARVPNPQRRRLQPVAPGRADRRGRGGGGLDGRGSSVGRQCLEHRSRCARRPQRGTAAHAPSGSRTPAGQLVERPVDRRRRRREATSRRRLHPGELVAARPLRSRRSPGTRACRDRPERPHPLDARARCGQRRPLVRRRLPHRLSLREGAARRRRRRDG